uniref:Uncharacterized protein n=1 Tax=Timema shepardi TaxID=629360 RepID=A0A7R9AL51_TIMSH|nr:unnamed protein product [Timema shepardi]
MSKRSSSTAKDHTAPKRTSSMNKARQKVEPKITWENSFDAVEINDADWTCSVALLVESTESESVLIEQLNEAIDSGQRRVLKKISYKELLQMVQGSGISQAGPRIAEDIVQPQTVPKPADISTHAQILREEALKCLGPNSEGKLPAKLLARLLKLRIMALKEETKELDREQWIDLDKFDCNRQNFDKRKSGQFKDHEQLVSKTSLSVSQAVNDGKNVNDTLELKKRRKEVIDPHESNHLRQVDTCKSPTKLKKRGEEWKSSAYIDDAPVDGAQLYIVVTGFYDPSLPLEMVLKNIPLFGFVKITVEEDILNGYNTCKTSTLSHLNNQMEDPDNITVHKTTINTEIEGHATEVREQVSRKFSKFWEEFNLTMKNLTHVQLLKNVAFMLLNPPIVPNRHENSKHKIISQKLMYDEIAYLMYDLQDVIRQHKHYLKSMKVIQIDTPLPIDMSNMYLYNCLVDKVPPECVTVSYVLHCMLEQVSKAGISTKTVDVIEPQISLSRSPSIEKKEKIALKLKASLEKHNKIHSALEPIKKPTEACEYLSVLQKDDDFMRTFHFDDRQCRENLAKIHQKMLMGLPFMREWTGSISDGKNQNNKVPFPCNSLFLQLFNRIKCLKSDMSYIYKPDDFIFRHRSTNYFEIRENNILSALKTYSLLSSPSHLITPENLSSCLDSQGGFWKCLEPTTDQTDGSKSLGVNKESPPSYNCNFVDSYASFDRLSKNVVLQVLESAYMTFNCVDVLHHKSTDVLLLHFHNYHDNDGLFTNTYSIYLPSPVGLRDFNNIVIKQESEWIEKEESIYQDQIEKTVQAQEAEVNKTASPDKYTTKEIQEQVNRNSLPTSSDNTHSTSMELPPDQSAKENKLQQNKSWRLVKSRLKTDTSTSSKSLKGKKVNTQEFSSRSSDTVVTDFKPFQRYKLYDKYKKMFLPFAYNLLVSWPCGLRIETVKTDYVPMYIKQCRHKKGPECATIKEEVHRCFLTNGNILKFMRNHSVINLCPDGTILTCLSFKKQGTMVEDSSIKLGGAEEVKKEDITKTKNSTISRKRVTHRTEKDSRENLPEETGDESEDFKREEESFLWDVTVLQVVAPDGRQFLVREDGSVDDMEPILVRTTTDLETGEVFTRRSDGTKTILRPNGTLIVSFPDESRITSYVTEECDQKNFTSRKPHTFSYLLSPLTLDEDFIMVNMDVCMEHPNYAKVKTHGGGLNMEIGMTDGITMKVFEDGTYSTDIRGEINLEVQDQRVVFTHIDKKSQSKLSKSVLDFTILQGQPMSAANSPPAVLCSTTDSDGNVFQVNSDGSTVFKPRTKPKESTKREIIPGERRCFVVKRDLTASELLPRVETTSHLDHVSRQMGAFLFVEPTSEDPSLNHLVTLCPLKRAMCSGHYEMPTDILTHRRHRNKIVRSTYGDPSQWFHPLPKRKCPEDKELSWVKRNDRTVTYSVKIFKDILPSDTNLYASYFGKAVCVPKLGDLVVSGGVSKCFILQPSIMEDTIESFLSGEIPSIVDFFLDVAKRENRKIPRGVVTRYVSEKVDTSVLVSHAHQHRKDVLYYKDAKRGVLEPYFNSIQGEMFLAVLGCVHRAADKVKGCMPAALHPKEGPKSCSCRVKAPVTLGESQSAAVDADPSTKYLVQASVGSQSTWECNKPTLVNHQLTMFTREERTRTKKEADNRTSKETRDNINKYNTETSRRISKNDRPRVLKPVSNEERCHDDACKHHGGHEITALFRMAERIVPSENCLVKYDNPVLVSKHPEKKLQIKDLIAILFEGARGDGLIYKPFGEKKDLCECVRIQARCLYVTSRQAKTGFPMLTNLHFVQEEFFKRELTDTRKLRRVHLSNNVPLLCRQAGQLSPRPPGPPARPKSEALTADARRETEEILNSILPPKEWEEENQLWRQQVSSTPATRLDVINLQEQLDMRLQQRQARETGICPVRRELYTQCFDELIRQVTINCAERGLLLLRVRDEIRMTIAAYQTLYESSIAFGMRKALMASIMIAQN